MPAPEGPRGGAQPGRVEVPVTPGLTRAGIPGEGRTLAKRESARLSRLETRRRGLGAVPEAQAGRGLPGVTRAALPLLVGKSGAAGAGPGPSFTNTLSPRSSSWGDKRRSVGGRAATLRGAAGAPASQPGTPEKPPSSEEEVFPPGNDLRDPRSAPGDPSRAQRSVA